MTKPKSHTGRWCVVVYVKGEERATSLQLCFALRLHQKHVMLLTRYSSPAEGGASQHQCPSHTYALLTALCCRFKPAPLYILDEVDAALDLNHTQNIGRMIKQHFPQSQFIIVSLKVGGRVPE